MTDDSQDVPSTPLPEPLRQPVVLFSRGQENLLNDEIVAYAKKLSWLTSSCLGFVLPHLFRRLHVERFLAGLPCGIQCR